MGIGWIVKPIAAASVVALSTLGILSRSSEKARLYFNATIFIATLGATSAWGLILSIIAGLTGQRFNINYYVARSFYQICGPLIGVDIEVDGEHHLKNLLTANNGKPQSAVIIGNHQSAFDILYLGRILPKRSVIMAKKELKWSPVLGQFMWLSGAVFIDRKNRKNAIKAVSQAGEKMKKNGVSLWIFPEGTRASHAEPALLPFKKGAFHLAVQAQIPIVPVVCENYHHLFDGKTRLNPGHLRVKVLPPIPTKGLTVEDVDELLRTTRDLMLNTLRQISTSSEKGVDAAVIDEIVEETIRPEAVFDSGNLLESKDAQQIFSPRSTDDEMEGDAVLLKRPAAAPATAE